jgi:death-on-curing protein
MHRDLIDSFGGAQGIRDEALLESALAQPEAAFGGQLLHSGVIEQAAAYLFHLCMDHPFVDGNKRTAFAAMDTFLRLNGRRLIASDEQAYELTTAVARGDMGKDAIGASIAAALVPS